MTEAAFSGTYADWRVIKGRKVVQIVLEVPLEAADKAYQVLGGMPIAANEIWCAVARLNEKGSPAVSQAEKQPGPDAPGKPAPVRADKSKKQFGELAPAQQAGILCNEEAFQRFLVEKHGVSWGSENAAFFVRRTCKVESRADIKPDNPGWSSIVLAYRLWKNHPEFAS